MSDRRIFLEEEKGGWMSRSDYDRRRLVQLLFGLLALFVSMGLFLLVFFHVESVEVRGASYYSEDEILEMVLKGPAAGNTILAPLFLSQEKMTGIPYLGGVRVTRQNHNTLQITVKENHPVGCLLYLDCYIYFDRNGIFVGSSRKRDETVPFFSGIAAENIILSQKLTLQSMKVLDTAVVLSSIFEKVNFWPETVEFEENGQIVLNCQDVQVLLGEEQNLEDKVNRAAAIFAQISSQTGVLHLEAVNGNSRMITFEPGKKLNPAQEEAARKEKESREGEEDSQADASETKEKTKTEEEQESGAEEDSAKLQDDKKEETDGSNNPSEESEGKKETEEEGSSEEKENAEEEEGSEEKKDSEKEKPWNEKYGIGLDYLDADGDGFNDFTDEEITEDSLKDLTYLDEDQDGYNDFTNEPMPGSEAEKEAQKEKAQSTDEGLREDRQSNSAQSEQGEDSASSSRKIQGMASLLGNDSQDSPEEDSEYWEEYPEEEYWEE